MRDLDSCTCKRPCKGNTVYQEEISYILDEVSSIKQVCLPELEAGMKEQDGM